MRDPAGLRRARRPQPGPGGRSSDRCRGQPFAGHRASRGRGRRRRSGGCDRGRHHGRQRADREHDRRGRAHARPVVRGGPQDRRCRCIRSSRRMEADAVHGARIARPDARDRRPRKDRPGDRRSGRRHGDGRPRLGSVRERRAGRPPRRRAGSVRHAHRTIRRHHGPRSADPDDARAEARRHPAQRRPGRNPRRGSRRRGPGDRPAGGRRDRRLRCRATGRLAAPRRAQHALDPAPRRVHGRGAGARRRGGGRSGPRRPRRTVGPIRRQRPAVDPRDRPGDRALPSARGDARPVLRPVRAERGPDGHARDRG